MARMAAVVDAQRAVAAGETGARYALRQSLVDLAASAELVAAELPAPLEAAGRGGWNTAANRRIAAALTHRLRPR